MKKIGRGGFLTIFTAELPYNDDKVVVKKYFDEDMDTECKCTNEVKLLNGLRHQNIVTLKGVCSD